MYRGDFPAISFEADAGLYWIKVMTLSQSRNRNAMFGPLLSFGF